MNQKFSSRYILAELARHRPRFSDLGIDSLGKGRLAAGNMVADTEAECGFQLSSEGEATFVYKLSSSHQPVWRISFFERRILLTSFSTDSITPANDLTLRFDQSHSFATLIGKMHQESGSMELPCLLHLPGQGSLAVSCNQPGIRLGYSSSRRCTPPYVNVTFPAATPESPSISYHLEVVAVYPDLGPAGSDSIYDGLKRNFLNIFQINPATRTLANNASSDPVPFIIYSCAEFARACPPLPGGFTCLDLVKMTVNRYLDGFLGYGQVGYGCSAASPPNPECVAWPTPWTSLDSLPSLLISAAICAEGDNDCTWARDRWGVMIEMAREMIAADRDGNGLVEYPRSGNFGDRPTAESRPSNWWDCINFGHEDAYSNALVYRASRMLAQLATRLEYPDDAAVLDSFADKLKKAYVPAFFNPSTGILAGWRSADGQLHDYWFTFVQSVAICCGLVEDPLAAEIMDRILSKMDEVGFNRFDLGLPGNLIPIPKGDYVFHGDPPEIFGEPLLDDGTDGFQYYENGGTTGCWVYYTISALYKTGRSKQAAMLMRSMLESCAQNVFLGFGENGMSRDWRDWKGGCHGYEGLLAENFLVLLAVSQYGANMPMETENHNQSQPKNSHSMSLESRKYNLL
jgi:hypothetical protein